MRKSATMLTTASTLAVATLLIFTGCAGTPQAGAESTLPPLVPSTSPAVTAAPTSSPTPTPTSSPSMATSTPRESVILACQTWQTSLTQASSEYPATQAKAKQLALDAAAADAQWQPVADDMTTLVALGTDSSPDAIATGQATFTDLGNQCRIVGVVVSAG